MRQTTLRGYTGNRWLKPTVIESTVIESNCNYKSMRVKQVSRDAEHFLNNEKQFHLGVLPTEQSNPKTRNIDLTFAENSAEGVKTLISVDIDIYPVAERIFMAEEFHALVDAGLTAIMAGKRMIFSGCGSTGRLSILLESMWRSFFRDLRNNYPDIYNKTGKYENSVFSIMTGGDYALIRSVESFEDYEEFGRQQVREMRVGQGDVLVGITEGGETSSVLGTVKEAADLKARVFLMFNNPAEILRENIERSRRIIEDPRVTILDLYFGPMAIAGSTRMQATTAELLVTGAALERILINILGECLNSEQLKKLSIQEVDFAGAYHSLLMNLCSDHNIRAVADYVSYEVDIYEKGGLVTYYADDLLPDIFTDTTERSPTFMVPPFRKYDDTISPPSWAFVKCPVRNTPETWKKMLGREFRCLEWDTDYYRSMNAPLQYITAPPLINKKEIIKYLIGNEQDNSRISRIPNTGVLVISARETKRSGYTDFRNAFETQALKHQKRSSLVIGHTELPAEFKIECTLVSSGLNLMERIAVKLILNTISTSTMVIMGRIASNWMTWVDVSNKKLKDRGIRLISEICGINYRDACYALHESIEKLNKTDFKGRERISPVQYTISRLLKSTRSQP